MNRNSEIVYTTTFTVLATAWGMVNQMHRSWFGSRPATLVKTGVAAGTAVVSTGVALAGTAAVATTGGVVLAGTAVATTGVVLAGGLNAFWNLGMLKGTVQVASMVFNGAKVVSGGIGTLLSAAQTMGKFAGVMNAMNLLEAVGIPITIAAGKAMYTGANTLKTWMYPEQPLPVQTNEVPVTETASPDPDTLELLTDRLASLLEQHPDLSGLGEQEQQQLTLLLSLITLSLLQAQALAAAPVAAALPAGVLAKQGLFTPATPAIQPPADTLLQESILRCVA